MSGYSATTLGQMVQKVRGGGQRSVLAVQQEFGRLFVKQNGKNSEYLDIQFKSYVVVRASDLR